LRSVAAVAVDLPSHPREESSSGSKSTRRLIKVDFSKLQVSRPTAQSNITVLSATLVAFFLHCMTEFGMSLIPRVANNFENCFLKKIQRDSKRWTQFS